MRLTEHIIKEQVIDRLDNKLVIRRAFAENDGVQKVKFCDIKWLKLYDSFLEGQHVIEYLPNNEVLLEVDEPLKTRQELTIKRPLFFYGTPYNTIEEWHNFVSETGQNREDIKLPFIWLKTPSIDRKLGYKSPFDRTSTLKLFYVHYSDWTKLNEHRVNQTIEPLHKLVEYFIKAINNNPTAFLKLENEGNTKDFPKFGKETANGVEQVYFNSTLAGVMHDLNLTIKKEICAC